MNNIKHFPQRNVRQDHWGDYEWRETMQKQPPVQFEGIDYRAVRAKEWRRLLVWACVTWALFSIFVVLAVVVAVS